MLHMQKNGGERIWVIRFLLRFFWIRPMLVPIIIAAAVLGRPYHRWIEFMSPTYASRVWRYYDREGW